MKKDIRINQIKPLLCLWLWLCGTVLFAQQIVQDSLPEVLITEQYRIREVRASAPTQILSRAQLTNLNSLQISDAVKHFAGVTVKDYGGIGGLKTVSLRSLGAEHTMISYDGIAIGNTQTGQVDIGRFSLDNVDQLSLSNGQSDQIFQSARLFAATGVLQIQTLTPQFNEIKPYNASVSVKTGSWGFINPSARLEQRIGRKWALATNLEWMSVDGRYPYTLHYGSNATDSTSREKRKNTEVRSYRVEVEAFNNISSTSQWRTKVYYYQSSRGLPGATILYYSYAAQHLWDKNLFVQTHYKNELSKKWAFQASAKWNWMYQHYLDTDNTSTAGKIENTYYQQEYYLSASLLYRMLDKVSWSLSSDGAINSMNADLRSFAKPKRYSWLTALAGKYVDERVTATASLLATVVNEKVGNGDPADNRRRLSPYVSLSVRPFNNEELRVRFFYKDIFRLPTFNDLYYEQIGSTNLQPEKTTQYNVGLTYSKSLSGIVSDLAMTVDAYYNNVEDKIVAIPTKNAFVWSMVNLGKVKVRGFDASGSATFYPCKDLRVLLSGNYTYQRAQNVTDATAKSYKHQIAYTPRSSASGQVSFEMPWINFSYALLFAGSRYVLNQNTLANKIDSYTDHSVSAYRDINIAGLSTSVRVELLNLFDKNYEIVRNFPMPGRSIRLSGKIIF